MHCKPLSGLSLNFQPLEVVSRYRDPQPQVIKNYTYLFILRRNIWESRCLNIHYIPNNSDLTSFFLYYIYSVITVVSILSFHAAADRQCEKQSHQ